MRREKRVWSVMLLMFILQAGISRGEILAAWRFNEGQGNVVSDSSGNARTGELEGNYEWVPGRTGEGDDYALHFDGQSGRIFFPVLKEDKALQVLSQLTFEFWVKLDVLPDEKNFCIAAIDRIFTVTTQCRKGVETWFGFFWVAPESGKEYYIATGRKHRDLKPGEWVHAAGVFDGKFVRLYVNGTLDMDKYYYLREKDAKEGKAIVYDQNQGVPYEGKIKLMGNFSIGCQQIGPTYKRDWLPGTLDDVMLYDTALKEDELGFSRSLDKVVGNKPRIVPTVDLSK